MVAWALLLGGLSAVSLCVGATSIFTGELDAGWILAISRFPRTAAALLTGVGLALAGVVVQQAVQNRMVEPSLIGTPEAAMLGLLAITLMAPGAAIVTKMSVAALAALLGMGVFLLIARAIPRHDPMLLPIIGLIYGGILFSSAIWIAWTTDLMQYLGTWRLGEFSGVMQGRYEMLWIVALIALLLYAIADRITLLGFGEAQARSLGLNYAQTRGIGLAAVAVITAVIVVSVGYLPFVGLLAPNIVSRWRGDNLRANLPVVAALGAASVLSADILGRVLRPPYEIPAGTIFAVFGACVFLWMLNASPARRAHG